MYNTSGPALRLGRPYVWAGFRKRRWSLVAGPVEIREEPVLCSRTVDRPTPLRMVSLALILAFLAGAPFSLASCRHAPAEGPNLEGTGDLGRQGSGDGAGPGAGVTVLEPPAPLGAEIPPAQVVQDASGLKTVAVGPFANVRSWGAVRGDLAWGWGDLADGRQVFFTVDRDGAVRSAQVAGLAQAYPLTGAQSGGLVGVVGVQYPDFRAKHYPVASEVRDLGPAAAVQLSPGDARILVFSDKGNRCWDVATWTSTPQPNLPVIGFPYAGIGTAWVKDNLVTVRVWEPNGGPSGIAPDTGVVRLVGMPDGKVVGDLVAPGDVLSPVASPGGKYLAVLHIAAKTGVVLPEAFYPADFGQSLDVYEVSALASGSKLSEVRPVATFSASEGKLLTNLMWSSDGTKLAFSETDYGPSPDIPDPASDRRASIKVASAPAASAPSFQATDAGLPDGDWVPVAFSPDGARLVVSNRRARDGYIWDVGRRQGVALPAAAGAVNPSTLLWVDDAILIGTDRPAYEDGRPLLVRASDGKVFDPGWARSPWFGVTGDGVAVRAKVETDGPLDPFPSLPAGEWIVFYPIPAEAR